MRNCSLLIFGVWVCENFNLSHLYNLPTADISLRSNYKNYHLWFLCSIFFFFISIFPKSNVNNCNHNKTYWVILYAFLNRYTKMDPCIFPLPEVKDVHDISGGALEKWPKRLNAAPPRITSKIINGITVRTLNEDVQLWRRRVSHYGIILKSLNNCKFRNVMDMNAGIGGFAAALTKCPVWVMNVVPFDAKNNTLGIVYERGLIGTYMNW